MFGIRDAFIILAYVLMHRFLHPYYKMTLREMQEGWWLLGVLGLVSYPQRNNCEILPVPATVSKITSNGTDVIAERTATKIPNSLWADAHREFGFLLKDALNRRL